MRQALAGLSFWIRPVISIGLVLVTVINGGCAAVPDFDNRLRSIAEPYEFNIAWWELHTLPREIWEWVFEKPEGVVDEVATVNQYFSVVRP